MAGNSGSAGPDLSGLKIEERERENHSGPKTWRTVALVVLGLVIVTGAVVIGRGRAPAVEAATVRPGGNSTAAALLNASGYVTPRRRATVAAKITARVVDVYVDEGMTVTEGQILARLDDSDAQRRLRAAVTQRDATAARIRELEVNLANAEREFQRQTELDKSGFTSAQEVDVARTTVESLKAQIEATRGDVRAAEAQIAVAQQEVDNCTVRAPFPGVVVSKDAQRGEMVSPISAGGGFTRTGIATIVDMDSIEIEVDVTESYIARVETGQRVEAMLDAYPDWRVPAKVRTVIPTADRQKATVKVRISFDQLDPRILPDMGVKVSFLAGERPEGQPQVRALAPRDAVRDIGGQPVAFVIRDGRLERRAVSLGNNLGAEVEVTAGLSPGEQVVVKGPERRRDGQRVKVKP